MSFVSSVGVLLKWSLAVIVAGLILVTGLQIIDVVYGAYRQVLHDAEARNAYKATQKARDEAIMKSITPPPPDDPHFKAHLPRSPFTHVLPALSPPGGRRATPPPTP